MVVCAHVQMIPDGHKFMTVREEADPTVGQ